MEKIESIPRARDSNVDPTDVIESVYSHHSTTFGIIDRGNEDHVGLTALKRAGVSTPDPMLQERFLSNPFQQRVENELPLMRAEQGDNTNRSFSKILTRNQHGNFFHNGICLSPVDFLNTVATSCTDVNVNEGR